MEKTELDMPFLIALVICGAWGRRTQDLGFGYEYEIQEYKRQTLFSFVKALYIKNI
jgi:hypothetical protein